MVVSIGSFFEPTIVGIINLGRSYPENPALINPVPLSITKNSS
jgi:hypothetical protein